MCAPAAVPVISAVATVGSAYGQYQAGKSAAAAAKLQGETANSVAELNARNVENTAAYNAEVIENSAIFNIKQREEAAKYNASILEDNAKIYERVAADAIERGTSDAAALRQEGRTASGRARAVAGSSGTSANSGTNLDLILQNAQNSEINAVTAMNNAEREAYGYKVEARNTRKQADATRFQAAQEGEAIRYNADLEKQGVLYQGANDAMAIRVGGQATRTNANYAASVARQGGILNAGSTLVTGAADFGTKYADLFKGSNSTGKGKKIYSSAIGPQAWR